MVCCGVVWCAVVWCGVVWCGIQTTQTQLLASVADLVESVTSLIQFAAETSLDSLFSDNQIYISQVTPNNNAGGETNGETDGETSVIAEGDTPILVDAVVADIWGGNLKFSAFDELNSYGDCTDEQAGTEDCKSIDWQTFSDSDKGDVLQVSYTDSAGHAGIVVVLIFPKFLVLREPVVISTTHS